MGIQSSTDRREIVREVVTGPKGNIRRMPKTYVFESVESNPAVLYSVKARPQPLFGDTSGTERKVLLRNSGKWKAIECMFVHPLVPEQMASPVIAPTENKGVHHDALFLVWWRSREFSPRIWSIDMLDREHINWLTVSLPYMQVCRDMLCDEIGKPLSD